jgi:hypothetical protein
MTIFSAHPKLAKVAFLHMYYISKFALCKAPATTIVQLHFCHTDFVNSVVELKIFVTDPNQDPSFQ